MWLRHTWLPWSPGTSLTGIGLRLKCEDGKVQNYPFKILRILKYHTNTLTAYEGFIDRYSTPNSLQHQDKIKRKILRNIEVWQMNKCEKWKQRWHLWWSLIHTVEEWLALSKNNICDDLLWQHLKLVTKNKKENNKLHCTCFMLNCIVMLAENTMENKNKNHTYQKKQTDL